MHIVDEVIPISTGWLEGFMAGTVSSARLMGLGSLVSGM
jgi:hypothetical protein